MNELGSVDAEKYIIIDALQSILRLKIGLLGDLLRNTIKSLLVYNHAPSLPGWQIPSGEILEACPEKQELNQNVPYRYFYLT